MKIGNYELSKGQVIGGVSASVGLFLLVSFISCYTSNRNRGTDFELDLTRVFKSTQVNYSQFRTSFGDQMNIASEKRAAMNKLLMDAVTGRFDKNGKVDNNAFFSAIAEAYPDLKGLDVYDKLLTFVQAGRERFAKDQETLADMVRGYDEWRTTGSAVHPWFVSSVCGFPSDALEVRVNGKVLRGAEALEKMKEVYISAEAMQIFATGVDQALPNN